MGPISTAIYPDSCTNTKPSVGRDDSSISTRLLNIEGTIKHLIAINSFNALIMPMHYGDLLSRPSPFCFFDLCTKKYILEREYILFIYLFYFQDIGVSWRGNISSLAR